MYMMLDSKIWKIQSCEHIQVPRGLDKWGPTVLSTTVLHDIKSVVNNLFLKIALVYGMCVLQFPWKYNY